MALAVNMLGRCRICGAELSVPMWITWPANAIGAIIGLAAMVAIYMHFGIELDTNEHGRSTKSIRNLLLYSPVILSANVVAIIASRAIGKLNAKHRR